LERIVFLICLALGGALAGRPALATPWAEVGDSQLRSDIEVLAAAGLIDNVVTQWPLPWGGLLARLEQPGILDSQPEYVRAAAARVKELGELQIDTDRMNYTVTADFTNLPDVVRGFDALGREKMQGQGAIEWMGETTSVRLQVGAQSTDKFDHQTVLLDGSYAAQRVGNAVIYAGYLTNWWGPGWSTALSLSNNARPFPQVGISRIDTAPFSSPWLSWMGPWQAEFFVGLLDGKRIATNTIFNGLRVAINPLPGLEFALARTEQMCGSGHPCKPLAEFFNVYNDPLHVSKTKDETNFDLRYTGMLNGFSYALYTQVMDRDTGPFVHSDSSHLFGASVWVPVRSTAVRFTAEYADTISTQNFFSFGKDFYGLTYTDFNKYPDGWQYRDRTLGSSLSTDSRLASFVTSWAGPGDWTYTLTYYRAMIASPQTPPGANIVTTAPVTIDIGEVRLSIPFESLSVDVGLRIQDDRPRPDHGFAGAVETKLTYRL
jgi:hypothetical protein